MPSPPLSSLSSPSLQNDYSSFALVFVVVSYHCFFHVSLILNRARRPPSFFGMVQWLRTADTAAAILPRLQSPYPCYNVTHLLLLNDIDCTHRTQKYASQRFFMKGRNFLRIVQKCLLMLKEFTDTHVLFAHNWVYIDSYIGYIHATHAQFLFYF